MTLKHIRMYPPKGVLIGPWRRENIDRIHALMLRVEDGADIGGAKGLDVFYREGEETIIIGEVLRYAGVISVCREGSRLDAVGQTH